MSEEPTSIRAEHLANFSKEELERRVIELEREKAQQELRIKNLESTSTYDELTGIKNRRGFNEALGQQFDLSKRNIRPFSLIFIDLDGFKALNTEFGRPKADGALILFAGFLEKNIRSSDILARWGGDEFGIILPEATTSDAMKIAIRLLDEIPVWEGIPIRFSCGIVEYDEKKHTQPMELLKEADRACDQAKNIPEESHKFVLASDLV